jgi:hypothetical protein
MTEEQLIELLQSGDPAAVREVLDRINRPVTDPVYLRKMEKLTGEGGEYEDLRQDPRLWKSAVDCNNSLRADPRYQEVSNEVPSEFTLQTARKRFGTEEQRWMAGEQARRRGLPAPDPFDREVRRMMQPSSTRSMTRVSPRRLPRCARAAVACRSARFAGEPE